VELQEIEWEVVVRQRTVGSMLHYAQSHDEVWGSGDITQFFTSVLDEGELVGCGLDLSGP
jgi:hypothetical protein